jgi:hypothetical protein
MFGLPMPSFGYMIENVANNKGYLDTDSPTIAGFLSYSKSKYVYEQGLEGKDGLPPPFSLMNDSIPDELDKAIKTTETQARLLQLVELVSSEDPETNKRTTILDKQFKVFQAHSSRGLDASIEV